MIRVGFLVGDAGWKGGINFFRNLLCALDTVEDNQILPIIITILPEDKWAVLPKRLQECEVIQYSPPTNRIVSILNNKIRQFFGLDLHLTAFFRSHSIDILSHATGLSNTLTPAVCWIPDFQHLKRPDFFSPDEIAARITSQQELCNKAAGIILSSNDALNDLSTFCPEGAEHASVLQFVAPAAEEKDLLGKEELVNKYGLTDTFFHAPNQFWKHKNHSLIVDALHILKAQGNNPLVVCTGDTNDHRHPEHYQTLLKKVEKHDVSISFRSLGVIPYKDVMSLVAHSVAVINPSYFEGWSSTVEESKSMGKRVILSNIPVHIEQAPSRCLYVDPDSPNELADAMIEVLAAYQQSDEDGARESAYIEFKKRQKHYGFAYHSYILSCLKGL